MKNKKDNFYCLACPEEYPLQASDGTCCDEKGACIQCPPKNKYKEKLVIAATSFVILILLAALVDLLMPSPPSSDSFRRKLFYFPIIGHVSSSFMKRKLYLILLAALSVNLIAVIVLLGLSVAENGKNI